MKSVDVTIVGGGIAGLYAANQLEARNISYQLFDIKPLFGGRITGIPIAMSNSQFFDLGPTFIFSHHTLMQTLVTQFGLSITPQNTRGDVLYQYENIRESRRVAHPPSLPIYRISGGAYALIRAMVGKLNTHSLYAGHRVKNIRRADGNWSLSITHKSAEIQTKSKQVFLAMPPRIIAREFELAKWMTPSLLTKLNYSQTWMAGQAKVVVTYATPFWREKGLSGEAFSQIGPLVEVHDASCSDTEGFALFGFIGIPATQRIREPQKELKQACIKQLAAMFGQEAYKFEKCYLKDWARDKDVCTGQDLSEGSRQPLINIDEIKHVLRSQGIYFTGSEFASKEAGYLEGALLAVDEAISALEKN